MGGLEVGGEVLEGLGEEGLGGGQGVRKGG